MPEKKGKSWPWRVFCVNPYLGCKLRAAYPPKRRNFGRFRTHHQIDGILFGAISIRTTRSMVKTPILWKQGRACLLSARDMDDASAAWWRWRAFRRRFARAAPAYKFCILCLLLSHKTKYAELWRLVPQVFVLPPWNRPQTWAYTAA